ncbi:SIS domain-containing protein [Chitinispirillales bacterium ANBcel5]|uniref:D-sedoheptulose-7-phosphate isomerase n=1 Tax=Cellulosispirillum alkaliphilum TaxID=3039283 RepID=UPI002A546643|nr:SIS domain-containing protein [Chitinispirillales bacterium ANBcel5]
MRTLGHHSLKLLSDRETEDQMIRSFSEQIIRSVEKIVGSFHNGGKVLVCGNGGSASDAEHIVGELMNKFMIRRPIPQDIQQRLEAQGLSELAGKLQRSVPAISLVSQSALFTAILNDIGPEMVFAQQVFGYGKSNDILIALSTSGNSTNVNNAAKVARALSMPVIGFSGARCGDLKEHCDILFCVDSSVTHIIQEKHIRVYHLICAMVESELFGA